MHQEPKVENIKDYVKHISKKLYAKVGKSWNVLFSKMVIYSSVIYPKHKILYHYLQWVYLNNTHKIRERKVKTLTRNWRDHWRIGTRKTWKQYRDILTGKAIFINQKRVNVCEHTTKMASLESLWKVPPGGSERNGNLKEIICG